VFSKDRDFKSQGSATFTRNRTSNDGKKKERINPFAMKVYGKIQDLDIGILDILRIFYEVRLVVSIRPAFPPE